MVTQVILPACRFVSGIHSVRKFILEAPIKGARFVQKGDPSRFVVVHPSTKIAGRWQVSYFDAEGASGDTVRKDADSAIAAVSAYTYELAEVIS